MRAGDMYRVGRCVWEQQLSGQSVMVPAGRRCDLGEWADRSAGQRRRALQMRIKRSRRLPAVPATAPVMNVTPAPGKDTARTEIAANPGEAAAASEKPIQKTEPIYTVDMPPLRFDASAKVQPEPDPRLMVIVRRVRVRPTLIFQGRVEGEIVAAATPPPVASAPAKPAAAPPAQGSMVDRVRSFFHRLWSPSS